jgi:small subunit ribosomal protein S15
VKPPAGFLFRSRRFTKSLPFVILHAMITKEKKHDIVVKHGGNARNTGDTAVQVALLTERINGLQPHFAKAPKDHLSRRGLLKMVGQRRRLLNFLRNSEPKRYVELLQQLNLRK